MFHLTTTVCLSHPSMHMKIFLGSWHSNFKLSKAMVAHIVKTEVRITMKTIAPCSCKVQYQTTDTLKYKGTAKTAKHLWWM